MSVASIPYLREIAHDFRTNNEPEAFRKFSHLDNSTKISIYRHLWLQKHWLCKRTLDEIARTFHDTDPYLVLEKKYSIEFDIRNKSRSKAIEKHVCIQNFQLLHKIARNIQNNKKNEGLIEFRTLPDKIKNQVFKEIWKIANKPNLHPQFGELAFFGDGFQIPDSIRTSALKNIATILYTNEFISPKINKILKQQNRIHKIHCEDVRINTKRILRLNEFTEDSIKKNSGNFNSKKIQHT